MLSIYLMGSWVVLQVSESLTRIAGLPDWVPSLALVLLLIGLPIVVATAFVQEGIGGAPDAAPSDEPEASRQGDGPQPSAPTGAPENPLRNLLVVSAKKRSCLSSTSM